MKPARRGQISEEAFWPTLGATGQISQLNERPGRKRKRVPFGFQSPKAKAGRKR